MTELLSQPEKDPKEILGESLKRVVEAARDAIAAGQVTRFGLELRSIADEVLHRDDAKHGIERTTTNRFEE